MHVFVFVFVSTCCSHCAVTLKLSCVFTFINIFSWMTEILLRWSPCCDRDMSTARSVMNWSFNQKLYSFTQRKSSTNSGIFGWVRNVTIVSSLNDFQVTGSNRCIGFLQSAIYFHSKSQRTSLCCCWSKLELEACARCSNGWPLAHQASFYIKFPFKNDFFNVCFGPGSSEKWEFPCKVACKKTALELIWTCA